MDSVDYPTDIPQDLVDNILNGILETNDSPDQLFTSHESTPELFSSPEDNSYIPYDAPNAKRAKSHSSSMEHWVPYYPATRQYFPLFDHTHAEMYAFICESDSHAVIMWRKW